MRVAFLGLGIMGSRMAAQLLAAGHEVAVWNRTRQTAEAWVAAHGGTLAATPASAATGADAVISMVVDGPQVEDVLLGPDGAAQGASPGTLVIDMSTIAAATAISIGARLAALGLSFLDAPVTGSSPAAETGTLTIMAGGEPEAFAAATPLFAVLGRTVVHAGPAGHGQLVKLINNAVAASNAVTAAQSLVAARAVGVDLDRLLEVMNAGSGGSAVLALKAGPMRSHDYPLLFKTEHMLKDVRHCLDAVAAAGASFPAAAGAGQVLEQTVAAGLGAADYAALIEIVEAGSGAAKRLA